MFLGRSFSALKQEIIESLSRLQPTHLDVINESWMHESPKETHFKITIVSPLFKSLSTLKRNYLVHSHLKEIWSKDLLFLSITSRTPEEHSNYESHTFIFNYPSH